MATRKDKEASTWPAFLRDCARGQVSAEYRSELDLEGTYPLTLLVGPGSAVRRILVVTKLSVARSMFDDLGGTPPAGVACFTRYGLPATSHLEVIHDFARRQGRPILFLGDLDPICLTTFLALRANDRSLRGGGRPGATVEHAGVNGRWLRALRKRVGRDKAPHYLIRMDAEERRHWAAIRPLHGWAATLGPEAVSLLDSGLKLESEGAFWAFQKRHAVEPAAVRRFIGMRLGRSSMSGGHHSTLVGEADELGIRVQEVPSALQDCLGRRLLVEWEGRRVMVVSVEGLKMKKLAGRPLDLANIAALESARGKPEKL